MAETAESDQATASGGVLASVRASLRETSQSLSSVFRNPSLRRVQLAFAGSAVGDWAYATAITVWAYDVGGATAVALWSAIRLGLMATTSPFTAGLADKYSRKGVMVVADLVRLVLIAVSGWLVHVEAAPAAIFVLATLAALLSPAFRTAQRSLLPSLVTGPEELTASNGASSTIESLSFFLGPALGAALIAVGEISTAFAFNVLTFVWSLVLVLGIKVPAAAPAPAAPEPAAASEAAADETGFWAETMAGFRAIGQDRDLLVVTVLVAAQTVVAGASAVFTVVMAVDILGTDPEGVGLLESMLGVGAIVGGFVAIARASRRRLGFDLTLGVALWALPLLLVVVAPVPVAVVVMMLVMGFANPLVDVNLDTIIQRVTPDETLGRVFGAIDAVLIATMALGSLAMAPLLHLLGLRPALAVVGVLVAVVALAGLGRMRALDRRLGVPEGLPLLQRVALFAPLDAPTVESLARALVRVEVAAGGVVVREGDASDLFYVIESGEVRVTQGERVLRTEGPGEFFGEIGLVRDVPRTATITALSDTVLQALPRRDFLAAVTGQSDVRRAVDDVVTRRLAV